MAHIRRMKRKLDVWLFLYEDNGEVIPLSTQVGYYGYYASIVTITVGLVAVAS